ncbi:hypothetical protein ACHAPU_000835 [Fusarium lateritium]
MSCNSRTPIIVGVGEIRQKKFTLENTLEPAELILSAIRNAVQDTNIDTTSHIDSISVVPPWSWNYEDLPKLLAQQLGIEPSHLETSSHGGHTPALLCDAAAARIATGDANMAVVTGGEALASLFACQKAGRMPPPGWTEASPDSKRYSPGDTSLMKDAGAVHSIGMPIQVYPLYENAYRKHNQQSMDDNHQESANLYAEFDKVACTHPTSWRSGETPRDADTIKAVTQHNRMICTPFWERPNYFSSPAIEYSLDKALELAGMTKDEIDYFDFYSCFPIVPKLACKHVGLNVRNPVKPITLLGGLTSFGGAGNNYSLHAITEMTRVIRSGKYRTGLVLANGGVLSWQHAICMSAQPRKNHAPYSKEGVLDNSQISQGPNIALKAQGEATIEVREVPCQSSPY